MTQPRRRRPMLKWCGLGLSLVLGLALVSSLVVDCLYARNISSSRCLIICLSEGAMGGGCVTGRVPAAFKAWRISYAVPDWISFSRRQVSGALSHWYPYFLGPGIIAVPLWIPFVLAALGTAVLWWRDRGGTPVHCCRRCGYDLTGNVSGVCPECGMDKATQDAIVARKRLRRKRLGGLAEAVVAVACGWAAVSDIRQVQVVGYYRENPSELMTAAGLTLVVSFIVWWVDRVWRSRRDRTRTRDAGKTEPAEAS